MHATNPRADKAARLVARQPQDRQATGEPTTVGLMNAGSPGPSKRRVTLFTVLNLVTLGLILAWLAFDWWAIGYLISH